MKRITVIATVLGLAIVSVTFGNVNHKATKTLATTGCFQEPEGSGTKRIGQAGCEYATPENVGATTECSATSRGTLFTSSDGQVIKNLNIKGNLVIQNKNITVENVCVTHNGGAAPDSTAVVALQNSAGLVVRNSTFRGVSATTQSDGNAFRAAYRGTTVLLEKDVFYNCGECVFFGNGNIITMKKSYVYANGREKGGHFEDFYNSDGKLIVEEKSTIFNPHAQTADSFNDTHVGGGGACDNSVTIKNSFLAGGGATVYPCGNATAKGGSFTFTGNRLARCTTGNSVELGGGRYCSTLKFNESTALQTPLSDGRGYYPNFGFFGKVLGNQNTALVTWSGNYADNNLESISIK